LNPQFFISNTNSAAGGGKAGSKDFALSLQPILMYNENKDKSIYENSSCPTKAERNDKK